MDLSSSAWAADVPRLLATRDDVGLAGAAAHRGHREIEAVRAALQGREIARNAVAGRLVTVELDVNVLAEELAGELHRVVDGRGRGGAGCVLERHAVERRFCR